MSNNILQISRHPHYCCDYWEWHNAVHLRCANLRINEETLDLYCKEGILLNEDQWPPIMECFKRIECDEESILEEIIFSFPEKER